MRLKGTESLLVLRSPASGSRRVELTSSLAKALPTWNGRDRVSPVFEVETAHSAGVFEFKRGPAFLLFLGPVNPAQADACLPMLRRTGDRAWLSFGLFNLVLYSRSRVSERSLVAWAKKHFVRWEKWSLNGTEIKSDSHSKNSQTKPNDLLQSLAQFRFKDPLPSSVTRQKSTARCLRPLPVEAVRWT